VTHALHAGRHRPPAIHVRPFWDPIATAYAAVDLVVARAGAMTLAELAAWGLPSILIPLPTAAADHQTSNALAFARAGAAIHLPESSLTSEGLAEAINGILEDEARRGAMASAARARGRPDAANAIAERLLTLL
jgi:UDP-N-acetylglucosamine--N-acetylmuramyl-(pentapeptide) pyrophosphoryl-undecaprenol N-acetylglucosamine transferase